MITNTMRYGFDTFVFNKSGTLSPKSSWDLTKASVVTGFDITATQPDNTSIGAVFLVDGSYVKLSADGTSTTAVSTQSPDAASIISEGNTIAELQVMTSVPAFVGKTVTPLIAELADPDADLPHLEIGVKYKNNQDVYVKVEESPEFDLAGAEIYNIDLSTTTTNNGSVSVEASLYNNGTWADYVPLMNVKGSSAEKVKFKATYTAVTINTSTAKINHLYVYTKSNNSTILGTNADVITTTQFFDNDMMYARLFVKHKKLIDAQLAAYISFTDKVLTRENYPIGTGTGSKQTISLADDNIDFSTFQLFANTTRILDFDFDTATRQISFTAPTDATILGNYSYNKVAEDWQKMTFGSTQAYTSASSDANMYSSDYTYSLVGVAKRTAAIRITLIKPEGSVTDAVIGTGKGVQQIIVLDHYMRAETMSLKAGDTVILNKDWTYDPVNKILTVIAIKDAAIKITGQYDAEIPMLTGFVAAFNQ